MQRSQRKVGVPQFYVGVNVSDGLGGGELKADSTLCSYWIKMDENGAQEFHIDFYLKIVLKHRQRNF